MNSSKMIYGIASALCAAFMICLFVTQGRKHVVPAVTTTQEIVDNQDVTSIKPTNVVFDLNGVLFTINRQKAVSHLGFFDVMTYNLTGNNIEQLEDTIFDILSRLDDQRSAVHGDNKLIPLHKDKPVPTIMCDWMKGTVSSQEVIDRSLTMVNQLDNENYFASGTGKKLVKKIIRIMFDPEIRCNMYKPLKKGVSLLKQCKELGHKTYLLSNMDSELIKLLQGAYPEIFELFDGVVVSADIHMIKPDANIYQYTMKTFAIEPTNCYFIDDQQENILGAQQLGITAIHHNQRKVRKTYRQLADCGVLPKIKKRPTIAQAIQEA